METNFCGSGSSSNSEIVRYKRDIPPAHYSFKVESSSLLLDTKAEKIESGGWFSTQINGKDYISLYLAIEETKSLPHRWEVNAELKLFVFDQKENNYLTIQDSHDGGIKRFHEMKTEWGFAKLIPLETFKDICNYGYLYDGCCVFGAEVFVIKPSGKYERVSMVKNPDHGTFTWTLEKFSTMEENTYFSKAFTIG
ncbi:hypothetical protein DITRI_Ditri11bG0170600 [Diplodiscus trichospermus]